MVCECNPVLDASMQHILTCLDHYNYLEAIFAAERIFAENPSDEIVYLLATCFYRSNLPKQAKSFLLLQDSKSPKCKFLLAKCFMDIGCAAEAENTLLGVGQDNTTPTDIALFYKETAPFVLLMLADIFKLSDRRKLAVACLKKCLDLNPFFWGAYKDLIDLRENVDPHEVFTLSTGLILNNHSCLRALSNKINIGDISHPNCPSKKRTDMHDSQEDLSVSRENVNPQYDENFNDSMHSGNDMISISQESLPYSFNRTPVRVEMDLSNNSDRMSTNSFNDCVVNNVERSAQLRQKLCSPKQFSGEDYDKTQPPMFGNIYSGPLSVMHACVPVCNMKIGADSTENLQAQFSFPQQQPHSQHNSLVLSHNSLNHSKKVRNTNKRISYTSFRPAASTPLVTCKSEKMGVFTHVSTPIAKTTAEYMNSSLVAMTSPLLCADGMVAMETGKTLDLVSQHCAESAHRIGPGAQFEHSSSGPRTRSQAAKAAAAQKSTTGSYSRKQQQQQQQQVSHHKDDNGLSVGGGSGVTALVGSGGTHCRAVCEAEVRLQSAASSKPLYESDNRLQSALNYLQLLIVMGKCYRAMRHYKNADVITNINLLPKHQAETSLVYSWQATAFMEMNNRTKACEILTFSHHCEPWQLHGMVLYSTLLWKINNEAQMMSLSNEINELDRESPEFWCIIGNTMSVKKENEIALRFFQRAIQVCPTFTYGYILLGHEYYEQDELDKALASFRKALEFDSNQYNSYCGIALVYQRQENYVEADKALKEALKINPESSFLLTNLAGIRMKLKQFYSPESSLDLLERACQSSPKDPLCRYQKAKLLYQLGKYHESLNDLKMLESIINKEARIYYLMSLNYKQLGDLSKAMVYNTWATDRDPKCTNDSFIFDRSFVTTPVMNIADHMSTNSSIMSSRNASFSINGGGRRNSESMQEDPSDNRHNSDLFTSD